MSQHFLTLDETVKTTILGLILESWRISRAFSRLLETTDPAQRQKYLSQFRFSNKQIEDHLGSIGLRTVNLEGQPFDTGLPASYLNLNDFSPGDTLVVDQMIEPVIMGQNGVVKLGTALLKRATI